MTGRGVRYTRPGLRRPTAPPLSPAVGRVAAAALLTIVALATSSAAAAATLPKGRAAGETPASTPASTGEGSATAQETQGAQAGQESADPASQSSTSAAPQDTLPTTLTARVVNERGEAVAEQDVIVFIIDAEQQITDRLEAPTSAEGAAIFEDVAIGTGYTAWTASIYETASYQGEPVELTPGVATTLPLTVYTVTDAPTNLHIRMLHVIINTIEPGLYQAVQVMSVMNPAEQAGFSGELYDGRPVGLVIPIPDTARAAGPIAQFSGLDPALLVVEAGRILDLRPVPPGSHQIAVQYELLTEADGSDIAMNFPYPTTEVSLLVGPGLGTVVLESDQLTELEPAAIPNQGDFANFRSDVIDAGGTLRFRLGPPSAPLSIAAWSLLALAVALFAGALVSMWGGRKAPAPGASETVPADPASERQDLLAQVARLDDQHAAGSIAEDDYHALRARAIARLVDIDGGPGEA